MKAIAFINIKTEPGIYYNKKIKDGEFEKFANNTHQVVVGIKHRNELHQWYYKNHGWYQGCYFIKNPMYPTMTFDYFKLLLKKMVLKLGFDEEGKKYFKGNCYGELNVKIVDFMNELMIVLGRETQNQNWSYKDTGGWKKGYGNIEDRFKIIDNYVNNDLLV
jgi:hypothetical protein